MLSTKQTGIKLQYWSNKPTHMATQK